MKQSSSQKQNPPTAQFTPVSMSLRPTPERREYASPNDFSQEYKSGPLAVLAIADVTITFILGLFVSMVFLASALMHGDGTGDILIFSFFIWMLPHAVFAVIFLGATKCKSISRVLSIIGIILNTLLMVAFWGSVIAAEFIFDDNTKSMPRMVYVVFFKSMKIWVFQALLAPIFIFVTSFCNNE